MDLEEATDDGDLQWSLTGRGEAAVAGLLHTLDWWARWRTVGSPGTRLRHPAQRLAADGLFADGKAIPRGRGRRSGRVGEAFTFGPDQVVPGRIDHRVTR